MQRLISKTFHLCYYQERFGLYSRTPPLSSAQIVPIPNTINRMVSFKAESKSKSLSSVWHSLDILAGQKSMLTFHRNSKVAMLRSDAIYYHNGKCLASIHPVVQVSGWTLLLLFSFANPKIRRSIRDCLIVLCVVAWQPKLICTCSTHACLQLTIACLRANNNSSATHHPMNNKL